MCVQRNLIRMDKDAKFLLCFSMTYRDFSVKSNSILSVSNSKNTIFEYLLFGTFFFLLLGIEFLMNSGSKTLPKGF